MRHEAPVQQGFHCFLGWAFWLLQGQRDYGVQQFEGSALGRGGGGQGGHGGAGVVVAVAQVDPGEGGQVAQQACEAVGGQVVCGGLGRRLVVGALGALGGGDGIEGVGPVLVGERQRRPSLT